MTVDFIDSVDLGVRDTTILVRAGLIVFGAACRGMKLSHMWQVYVLCHQQPGLSTAQASVRSFSRRAWACGRRLCLLRCP